MKSTLEAQKTECILCVGKGTTKGGYGRISIAGKRYRAHVLAYMDAYGPIPEGLIVRHKCDVPLCINPKHLEMGTHQDNTNDMLSRGRARYVPHKGEDNGFAKFTDAQITEIKMLFQTGEYSQRDLCRQFNISPSHMNRIVRQMARI